MKTKVNMNCLKETLPMFLKHLRKKRPSLVKNGWYLHMDNCNSHTARTPKEFIASKSIMLVRDPPYSSNFVLVDFLLLPTMKRCVWGSCITDNTVKKVWEGGYNCLTKEELANAFKKSLAPLVDHWELVKISVKARKCVVHIKPRQFVIQPEIVAFRSKFQDSILRVVVISCRAQKQNQNIILW